MAASLPQGQEKVRAVREMFDTIAPRYDLVNRLITFGMDVRWRKRTVKALHLAPDSVVVDVACGTGDLCRDLARHQLVPIGIDLSLGMLASARTEAPLVQGDALHLAVRDGSVDGVTCGFGLRNFVELRPFFEEAARVLRPGGRIAFLEVSQPSNAFLKAGHGVYFGHVVPRLGGWISDADAYRYLPRSVAYMPPMAEVLGMLRDAGFTQVGRKALSGGIAQLLTGVRERGDWRT